MALRLPALLLALATLGAMPACANAAEEVDVELVLAVDVSFSMDPDEQRLQRQGYMDALRDEALLRAIRGGPSGRIAITYLEWAGWGSARVLVPWTILDGEDSAQAVVARLAAAPITRHRRTSISGALEASGRLFEQSPFRARRRVVDISGDGPNNDGPTVEGPRAALLARGATINGLPILLSRPVASSFDIANLDWYYEDCIIGGPGAFIVPVTEAANFAAAIRAKLILEITGVEPPARVVPASNEPPRIACDIGERLWRRWQDP